ncbi:hypothetical protein LX77_00461 [Gelidibacter algens]|jgi:hypothetical protein|uniref:Lipoprotein n=1 Tax=Gelidibacter algens TaxID=49280 RepID=A0A1A7QZZ9_9FLAO|nr:hypothetical protein [Gelidibacter algens]OBX25575.1 hypothetical protein A9996_09025 [Gelidibacter algens]RAJ27887.1 hypothetical protein LX77_00461 [Gelidibacter algens]
MRCIKITALCIAISTLTNCASGYKLIAPKSINYISTNEIDNVKLEYKYDLLDKKYAKKEVKKGVKLVAIKITNNSDRDLMFGRDVKLTYANGSEIYVMENEKVFKTLKQSPASYLFYLLLTPMNLYTSETSSRGYQETTSSFPIGLILGPGLAGGHMIAASSANKKFKTEMLDYNINGTEIKKGETKYGLIGIKADSFDSLKLKIE